ncbi:DUF3786 domain-containing protein [Thermodesulfobacteriota bacterium]
MVDDNSESSVFEKTFSFYLDKLDNIDPEFLTESLGVSFDEKGIAIQLLNEEYIVSKKGVADSTGKRPSFDLCIILLKYLLTRRTEYPSGSQWTAFRDLRDSGPLTVYYRDNVERAFSDYFTGNTSGLKSACINTGGIIPEEIFTNDVSMKFNFLPRIPMLLLFNDKDEDFSASCSVLFEQRSENYLDAECIAMAGSVLFSNIRGI